MPPNKNTGQHYLFATSKVLAISGLFVHRMRLQLGIHPGPHWVSLQHSLRQSNWWGGNLLPS